MEAICSTTKSSEPSPLTPLASCQEQSILRTMPFRKKKTNLKKNPATSKQGKPSLLHRHASLCRAEVNEKHTHTLAPGPPKAFLFLPPPTAAATPVYFKMTLHEPRANFQASARCISLSHAQAIPSITCLHFQEITRILGLRTRRHTCVLPLPRALGMKCFLHFHWWEVRSQCWHAAWLGNQKQTPPPL